ncbi:MAG: polyprenyl synthetase family protein [Clostridia bacterium]
MIDWGKVPGLADELKEMDRCIKRTLDSRQPLLRQTVKELVEAGGKRLRPALLLLAGRFGRKFSPEDLIPLAAIIEILHMATLIHDDVIDDAVMRRGKPSVQARWGKDVAVFTGDFLLSKAFFLLTEKTSFEHLKKVASVMNKICEGEIEQYQSRFNINVSLKQYLKRINYKTAILFALSTHIGAQQSGCSQRETWQLRRAGLELGMAFQIQDDILDFEGKQGVVGKPVGNDFLQGVFTLPLVYALNHKKYEKETRCILSKEQYEKEDVQRVIELVHISGGIDYARSIRQRYHQKALNHIRALADIPARRFLEDLIIDLAGRQY